MRLVIKATLFLAMFFNYTIASAGSMTCGVHIIVDGLPQGQSREEIKEKCGTPKNEAYGEMFYEIDGVTYQLRFTGNDELETITEE
jgi:hypothetical protein